MRKLIKTEEIKPGFKAFAWEAYCMRIDALRRDLIPGYKPEDLSDEEQMKDWNNFLKYYAVKFEQSA